MAARIVDHPAFDIFFALAVIANSVFIGIEVQILLDNYGKPPDVAVQVVRDVFVGLFFIELLLRILADGFRQYLGDDWMWMWLDTIVVLSSLWELGVDIAFYLQEESASENPALAGVMGFKAFRIIRITRIVKTVRILRVFRFVMAFRTLITSILHTIQSLCWALLLLVLIMYVFAVLFTQAVNGYILDGNQLSAEDHEASLAYFSSVADTMLSLFMSVSGGVSWEEAPTSCMRSTPSEDERVVLERASQLHLEMTRIFVRYCCALLCTGFALQQWRVARDVSLTTSATIQGTMLSGLGVFMLIDSCPAILTVGRLNALYVLVSLYATVSLSPWHVQLDRVLLMELCFLAFGRIPAVVIARLLWLSFAMSLDVSVVVEVSGFIATVCTSVAVQLLVKSRVERNLQYGKMTADFNASSSLLQLVCDSIVELDADLQIAEHSPALAAMLLRDRPGTTLAGMDFTDLIPGAAEAGRAAELLRKFEDHPSDSLKAQAFHTHLVDSDANRFRTEVFQVTYHTLQGRVRHLIGLRDVTDQGPICRSEAAESFSIIPRTYTPMSAATCSSIESQPADGNSEQRTHTIRVARLDSNKMVSLEIDMNLQIVCTSSEPAYVGKRIEDLLSSEGLDLLETCWVESQSGH
ncbi:CACNA1F, partial [Symbiodinium sp. CCMP2456]